MDDATSRRSKGTWSSPRTHRRRVPARLVDDFTPQLIDVGAHSLCPGCGEPIAMRSALEAIAELGVVQRTIAVFGIGCYTAFSNNLDVEVLQALHGRAPSLATGVKRAKPDTFVFTVQGDGDMVNEGLQEVLHAAARGEQITCIMLNNGVFGETGGHMTATTVLGQRTKNTLDGRDAAAHGYPIRLSNLIAELEGAAYVARGAVNNAGNVAAHEEDAAARVRDATRGRRGSRSSRSSPCARRAGSSRPTRRPTTSHEHLGSVHGAGRAQGPRRAA